MARTVDRENERRVMELKNKIFASNLFAKPRDTEEEKIIYLSPSKKMNAYDLLIDTANTYIEDNEVVIRDRDNHQYWKGEVETDQYDGIKYWINMNADVPFVFCDFLYGTKDLVAGMCNIADREQLNAYGKIDDIPVCVEPNEDPKIAYQRCEKNREICEELFDRAYKSLEETFGEGHKISISDYAKDKKLLGKNPQFPYSAELVAYGLNCAKKNAPGKECGEEVPALFRKFGRDPKVTEEVLKCLEPGRSNENELVFNKDKIKALSENYAQKRTQTRSLNRQAVYE